MGKPRLRPSLVPCATRPPIAKGRPSSASTCARFAFGQRTADRARRRALAFDRHRAHRFDAEHPRGGAQRAQVAAAPLAEAEILADQQPACADATDEHVVDEHVGRERGELGIEAHDVHAIHTQLGEAFQLGAQRGQPRRRRFVGEELARMRLERHHGGRQREILRGFGEPGEHRLMAAMDAVEIADRQRDTLIRCRRQASKNPHEPVPKR